jgi:guanylate kinase
MNLLKKCIKLPRKIRKGLVIVISAPSGTGKTTVCKYLLENMPNLEFSVSYTTRPKREGEIDGIDYHFVDKKKFLKMVKEKKFVEWAVVYDNYYGTPKKELEKTINSGTDILLDIDVQGGKNIRKFFPNGIYIFLLPPSWTALKKRLINRGKDSISQISLRLKNAQKELKYMKYYDYFVVNDNLNQTFKIIESIITAEKHRRERFLT